MYLIFQYKFFELDTNVKFPLLRLLQFLCDLKCAIDFINIKSYLLNFDMRFG